MRCTVKAVSLLKSYIKKDGNRFMGGYSLVVQDFPLGPVLTVFSVKKYEENSHIYISPVVRSNGSIFYRIMTDEEIALELSESGK